MAMPRPAEDLRQLVLAAVLAQAGPRDALEALDRRLAFVVLQRDLELGLGASPVAADVADVALVLQQDLAIASFTLEAGMETGGLPTASRS